MAIRISVIVPFYYSERFIARCIASLLAQENAPPYELLFVDNGSQDGSRAVVESMLAGSQGRLRLLREPKPGAYAARNHGLEAARGELIAFTDADCEVAPDWLARIDSALGTPHAAPTSVVLGRCDYPSDASRLLHLLARYENAKASYVLRSCSAEHRFAYANNMALQSTVIERIGPFREWNRAADSELVHRLAEQCPEARVAFVPQMRITHLEFVRARRRFNRLRLYTSTNTQIGTFRELSLRQRLRILLNVLLD